LDDDDARGRRRRATVYIYIARAVGRVRSAV
jgi:hypothetical protein